VIGFALRGFVDESHSELFWYQNGKANGGLMMQMELARFLDGKPQKIKLKNY